MPRYISEAPMVITSTYASRSDGQDRTENRKGSPKAPKVTPNFSELEDDLASKLYVAPSEEIGRHKSAHGISICVRRRSCVDLRLTTRNKQVGMVEQVVRFKAQLEFHTFRDAQVFV